MTSVFCSSVVIMRANVLASVLLLVPHFIFAEEHSDACLHSPHHLRIKYFDNDYCDAGLYVTEGGLQVALTSASCLNNIQNEIFSKHLSVFAGKPELDLQKPHLDEQFRIVTDFVLHPDWNNKNNDIAIVFLKSNFEETACVKPLKALPNTLNPKFMPAKVSASYWSHRKIRQNTVHINQTCKNSYLNSHLCAESCISAKYGGGPAVSTVGESNYLVGIWSHHEENRSGKCLHSVFTNVILFTKWIESQAADYLSPSEPSKTSSTLGRGRGKRFKRSPRRKNREFFFPGTNYARSNYESSYERPIIEPRVAGAHTKDATPTSAFWYVQIRYDGDFLTNGGLVTGPLGHQLVLTAAGHVFVNGDMDVIIKEELLEVKAGMLDKDRDSCFTQDRYVRKLMLHPLKLKRNIVILWLDKQFHVNEFVKPLPLPPRDNMLPGKGAMVQVAGYGKGDGKFSTRLQTKVTEHMDHNACVYYGEDAVGDPEMCTGEWQNNGKGGPCQGDEGTVARIKDQQTKIVYAAAVFSYSRKPCNDYDNPPVYTRISSVLSWIKEIDEKITEEYGPFPGGEDGEEYLP